MPLYRNHRRERVAFAIPVRVTAPPPSTITTTTRTDEEEQQTADGADSHNENPTGTQPSEQEEVQEVEEQASSPPL